MGKDTKIQWCDATFSPWWGCTKVSPACNSCYAETWAKRTGFPDLWGTGNYRLFGDRHWRQPLLWNERAMLSHTRLKVFCASMADVFDKDAPAVERARLWRLILATPWLDWLLLTKRIGNARRMLPDYLTINVWLGASVVTREEFERDVPKLRALPARVRFLSVEPLLEDLGAIDLAGIDWVIVGGESGPKARHVDHTWYENILEQCVTQSVPFFMKQLSQHDAPKWFKDFGSFPHQLQVRQWPRLGS